jgi:hypothetical protein
MRLLGLFRRFRGTKGRPSPIDSENYDSMREAEVQALRRRVKELETENAELLKQVAGSETAQLRQQLAVKDVRIATLENEKRQVYQQLEAAIRRMAGTE